MKSGNEQFLHTISNDLSSDEAKLIWAINNMTNMVEHIENLTPIPGKVESIRTDIRTLQKRLDELRSKSSN